MDPRLDIYVTFVSDEDDAAADESAQDRAGRPGKRTRASRESGLKKRGGLPIRAGKTRRRRRTGGTHE